MDSPIRRRPIPNTYGLAIAWGIDDNLKTPYSHVVDFSITRELAHNFVLEATYTGRFARHLLQEIDLSQPLDLVDPASKTDYFTAAQTLERRPTQALLRTIRV